MAIVVTGAGGGVGHAVVDSLRHAGMVDEIVGLDLSYRSATMARLPRRSVLPPVEERTAYVSALLSTVEREGVDLLIPGLDIELSTISGIRPDLHERGCVAIVSDPAVVEVSVDKLQFATFAREHEVPHAATWSLSEACVIGDELGFPLIVKPRYGSASRGVRVVRDAAELRGIEEDHPLVVQQFLPPRGLDGRRVAGVRLDAVPQLCELSVQVLLDQHGTELGRFASFNRLRDGVPVDVEPVTDQVDLSGVDRCVAALAQLGARGPINLQGRLDVEGVPVFFEANARFTGLSSLRSLMGFREVEAIVRSARGESPERVKPLLRPRWGVYGFRPPADIVVESRQLLSAHDARQFDLTGGESRDRPLGCVVVTGATGYLGRTLVRAMDSCVDVRSLRALPFRNEQRWEETLAGADTVIHLAALRPDSGAVGHEFTAVNVAQTARFLALCRRANVGRVLFASTQAVYGPDQLRPWGEKLMPAPSDDYGNSKWAAETLIATATDDRTQMVSLRFARLFGVGEAMRWNELPHAWARRALHSQPLIITGDGRQEMDLLDVADAASAVIAIARSTAIRPGEAINVGSGDSISLTRLASVIDSAVRDRGLPAVEVQHTELESAGQVRSFGMAIDRIAERSGWLPRMSLRASIDGVLDAAQTLPAE